MERVLCTFKRGQNEVTDSLSVETIRANKRKVNTRKGKMKALEHKRFPQNPHSLESQVETKERETNQESEGEPWMGVRGQKGASFPSPEPTVENPSQARERAMFFISRWAQFSFVSAVQSE
ncbi:hypothetical protein AVEN_63941-1 [Araneus ventricosus]|uniref:Uncharacterized protein n=1 Tax=Araneus ventricosus TaxID=182803 RepID=A0A4Y2K3J4_ARAVE|nr:hypothetical protein AVEN_63941-1 [Araneus ventricosus]